MGSQAVVANGYAASISHLGDKLLRNDSAGAWVVQKYGGTSVGKFASNIAEDIIRPSLKGNKIAVVCSARSTGKKVEGTTSRLLEIFSVLAEIHTVKDTESVHYESLVAEYERLVLVIQQDHISAAHTHIRDERIREGLIGEIEAECRELIDYRLAAERWKLEIDARSKDRIVSFGEKLSCRVVAALLRDRGIESDFVDLSDVVPVKAGKSLDLDFFRCLAASLKEKVLACEDRVPIITGYFGTVPGGLMDGEVGRGYTDLCAALVAVGLKAEELQVWKEVDGIFTADPTKVPTARLLATITPAEAAELTFYGSEVIHHLTMDQVIHANPPIQIRIKNVKNPRGNGTIVIPDPVLAPGQLSHSRSRSSLTNRKTPKRPTAVTIKDKISVINVHSNKRSISHGFFAKVFKILNELQLSVDLISTSEVHVSMAIHSANISAEELQKAKKALEECGEVSVLNKMAILSLVGAEMKHMVGIAGRMFSTLGEHNVNIEMISQGASEINISCVIEAFEATRAMTILHTNLFTFLE
ncbi:Aspartate kinase FUB3 [Hyphodiscus hymeniophilus]|uniref:Aspartokinase n=1 Tax=Hyphodiscus hymeniophilus TaxID=353542 RepID=A0A9P6VJ18_9HELO|nr:Aspartate kinase FUB3 [Hyphodiscus hymeniophilus]